MAEALNKDTSYDPLAVEAKRARLPIFLHGLPTSAVLIKQIGSKPFPGLKEKSRDELAAEKAHYLEALKHNIDFDAYERKKGDSGICVVENGENVFIEELVKELEAHNFGLSNYYWHKQYDKEGRPMLDSQRRQKMANVFVFSPLEVVSKGERIKTVPEEFISFFTRCYNFCHCWINWDGRQTVNLIGFRELPKDPEKLKELKVYNVIMPTNEDDSLQKTFHLVQRDVVNFV